MKRFLNPASFDLSEEQPVTEQNLSENINLLRKLKECMEEQKDIIGKTKTDLFSILIPNFDQTIAELETTAKNIMT